MSNEVETKATADGMGGTALVPAPQTANLPAKTSELPTLAGNREWHNFDGTPKNRWRLKALCQSCAQSADEIGGEIIPIKYWYAHEVQLYREETKTTVNAIRVCLVRPDCSCVAFVSEGVFKSLVSMCEAMGNGPYEPPLEVQIEKIKTRNGHTYSIVPAEG